MSAAIRLARDHDADQIAAIYAPIVRDTVISFEFEPPSVDEMRQRIKSITPQFPWLVCDCDGVVLGYAYAGNHRERAAYQWSVDVSVYVHERARRAGVGRALYTSLFAVLALQGYRNAYAGATLPNAGSVALHESVGFERVGVYRSVGFKAGAWHDVIWWQRELQARSDAPAPPRSIAEVQDLPAWRTALAAGQPLLHLEAS